VEISGLFSLPDFHLPRNHLNLGSWQIFGRLENKVLKYGVVA
jgi:hypothetical protein